MVILVQPQVQYTVKGRVALIDADIISYFCTFGLDDYPQAAVVTKLVTRCNQLEIDLQAEYYRYYLTGKTNFRNEIATVKQYKGNRYNSDGSRKTPQPKHLQFARQWLVSNKSAKVSVDQEADDDISIAMHILNNSKDWHGVISTTDKDLGINEGILHNQTSNEIKDADKFGYIEVVKNKVKGRGLKFFYTQLLMGDTVDSIPGLPKVTEYQVKEFGCRRGGCGDMCAYKTLDSATTPAECLDRVKQCYDEYWTDREYTPWNETEPVVRTPSEHITEQGQLLWMRHTEGEMWSPN